MERMKKDGVAAIGLEGEARNCEATDRTSLRDSRERRVMMLIMVSAKGDESTDK